MGEEDELEHHKVLAAIGFIALRNEAEAPACVCLSPWLTQGHGHLPG